MTKTPRRDELSEGKRASDWTEPFYECEQWSCGQPRLAAAAFGYQRIKWGDDYDAETRPVVFCNRCGTEMKLVKPTQGEKK